MSGENETLSEVLEFDVGSSPRERGKLELVVSVDQALGLIPA